MMRTIETTGVVAADHTITLKLPDDVPEGNCQIVVVIQDEMEPARKPGPTTFWKPALGVEPGPCVSLSGMTCDGSSTRPQTSVM